MKKSTAIKVLKLIKQWTRAEIMARHGVMRNLEFCDYYMKSVQLENEIRMLLYGTDNLVTLGEEWGLLKPRLPDHKVKKKLKKMLGKGGSKL